MIVSHFVYPTRLRSCLALLLAILICSRLSYLYGSDPAVLDSERKALSPKSLLLDIARVGEEVIVVGERGHVLKSRDKGVSWRQIIVPTRATLTNVYFIDERYGWISGHSGIILATSDGGNSWIRLTEPDPEISYFVTYFKNRDEGFFAGAYGEYSVSGDSGKTLESDSINENDPHFYSLAKSAEGTLYLAGEMGQLMRSLDDGKDWETLDFPYEGSLFDVLCLRNDTLLTYGLRGHIFRSEDQGDTWEEIESGVTEMLTTGVVLASGKILLATVADQILMSNDQGMHFHTLDQPGIDGTTGVLESRDESTVFFCGRHGVLPVRSEDLENKFMKATASDE